jgi:hypothetical protein
MSYRGILLRMKVDKLSVSFDATLGDNIRNAARKAGTAVSSWLAEAATAKLRTQALREFLDTWESEHAPLTVEELRRAEAELGISTEESS